MPGVGTGLKILAVIYFFVPDVATAIFNQRADKYLPKFKLLCWAVFFVLIVLYH